MGGKEILYVEREISLLWCLRPRRAWSEITALWLPPLPGQRTPRPGQGATWIHEVRDIQAAHTNSEKHTHSCSSKHQLGECQRERGILSAPGSGRGGRPCPAVTVRDFWLFGEVGCVESWKVIQCCSKSVQRDFF